MLDELDSIDWASLNHAYGTATDVPALLRLLMSDDIDVCEKAISNLFSYIWHQGTVYSSSAAAVPFLYELLNTPHVIDKPNIAYLLAHIAIGAGYLQVHTVDPDNRAIWRAIFEEQGKLLEDEIAKEADITAAVKHAISAHLQDLRPYLNTAQPEIRESIAIALSHYPEHVAWSLPALDSALQSEVDKEVQKVLQESKKRLIASENL